MINGELFPAVPGLVCYRRRCEASAALETHSGTSEASGLKPVAMRDEPLPVVVATGDQAVVSRPDRSLALIMTDPDGETTLVVVMRPTGSGNTTFGFTTGLPPAL